jgi:hypothetical protein
VEADPAWQAQQLGSILEALNGHSKWTGWSSVVNALNFLDTPQSIRELARLITQPGGLPYQSMWSSGLMGSRHQEIVLRELEERFAAPDAALTYSYLEVLAETKYTLTHEPPELPKNWGQESPETKAWGERRGAALKQLTAVRDSYYRRLANVVEMKQGAARAETVQTLLQHTFETPSDPEPAPHIASDEVVSAFSILSPQQQGDLLFYNWSRVKTPAMAGALKKVLDQPELNSIMLRGVAIERLLDLDREAGYAYIRKEILQPHLDIHLFTVSIQTLAQLPDATLPELDQVLVKRLEDRMSRTAGQNAALINRYATAPILPRVKAVYASAQGKFAEDIDDSLVSYFLRVDPDYGVQQAVSHSATLGESLATVGRMKRWAEVEPPIIARLNGPDLAAASKAAETLGKFGGEAAEKALWARMEAFHEEWKSRENDFPKGLEPPKDLADAVKLQDGLVAAISGARGWLLDNLQLDRLEHLIVGPPRENVRRWHWQSPVSVTVQVIGYAHLLTYVNYLYFPADADSLCAKLAQYPSGTHFWLNTSGPREDLAPILQVIRETARRHSFTIDVPPGEQP